MRSRVLEERPKRVNPETRESVALSFRIVDRTHDILHEKGLKQKDLALKLGKSDDSGNDEFLSRASIADAPQANDGDQAIEQQQLIAEVVVAKGLYGQRQGVADQG